MATTQDALTKLIEQVPDADRYGLDLIKEKVEFLRDVTPRYVDPTPVGATAETPVFDSLVQTSDN